MCKNLFSIRTLFEIAVGSTLVSMLIFMSFYNKNTTSINNELKEESYALKQDIADYRESLIKVKDERDYYKRLSSFNEN